MLQFRMYRIGKHEFRGYISPAELMQHADFGNVIEARIRQQIAEQQAEKEKRTNERRFRTL